MYVHSSSRIAAEKSPSLSLSVCLLKTRDSILLTDMIKVEHMGVSPSRAKSKKENHCCPEESTSQQAHEFGSEYLHSELSENKHRCGCAVTQNESAEIATCVSSSAIHEPSSEYVAKNSSPEHLGLLPKGASGHDHTDKSFYPQETVSGKTHKYCSQYVNKETSENKNQPSSEIVQNELEEACTFVCGLPAKHLQPFSEDLSKNAITEGLGLPPDDSSKCNQTDKLSCPQLDSSEPTVDFGSGNMRKKLCEPLEQRQELDSKGLPNGIEKSTTAVSSNVFNQILQLNPEDMNKSHCSRHLQSPPEGASSVIQTSKSSPVEPLRLLQEFAAGNPSIQQPSFHIEDMAKNSGAEQHEIMPKNLLKNSGRCRDGKTSKRMKKKYMLRSLTSSDRILRSKSQDKPKATESSNILADVGSSEQQKRRKRKKRKAKREVADEYSRIRAHLRYLLNRMNYEQSLIAVYSAEGWKGLSLEKLKPEKELQRATSEILRLKLKIRDLFQRIDSLCAEGRLPESLFDSEGQIDSEDIFCAKCGSKDLSSNNDIILCDGACDCGFHQYCLQPPLLKEDIPPDHEGWLCPRCDCKVDCIELVNESQGTSFSLTDSWEVFPEAAVAAGGQNQDPNFGLPSDDSDDNDYNPDSSETDEKDWGDESSSDESDFTSTSEELEAPAKVNPYLELRSDDSEDDDYDPNGPDHDNAVKPESSSSDFTSDSEDLGAMLEDNISSQKEEGAVFINASRDSKRQKPKLGGRESLNDELLSVMESASEQDGAAASKKRSIERLDYKRLYDETYGSVSSSSSDDDYWNDATALRKRKKCAAEAASAAAANGNVSVSRSVSVSDGLKLYPEGTEHKPRRKTRQKSNLKDTDLSPAELQVGTSVSGSSGKKVGSSTYRRLGEAVKQRLHSSFKENQYPDRATKESLAKELEMTFQQVSKWFENARWSFNNSPSINETTAKKVSENDITSARPKKNCKMVTEKDKSKC
ncbi:homeobox protein HAT3.1-like isoform X2 [Durio zibethinus]|uniref:Homeobox protein HAT3.1-like isoform X2 n=1 Tax=Durio zibethinus TaxID=66656 RepID=A0A6P5YZK5_DURZI|nr:homeobox protein HAT3.1-like isoform X2 [Durio zibethinus]